MAKKLYDMVVNNGTYKNHDGEEKVRWLNVGSFLESDKGPFLLVSRAINFAGVVGEGDSESVLVSLLPADRDKSGGGSNAPF